VAHQVHANHAARRRWLKSALALVGVLSVAALAACDPTPQSATPEGAVREFVEVVRGFHGAESDAQQLFELLSERAKSNLRTRAERYGAASGKKIAPWAMLVPSRMAPRFTPQSYTAQVVGKYALVEVVGVGPNERARVPCVLEDDRWRVDLVLPELPELQRRPGSDVP
jgi:hypothetical protein